MFRKFVTKAAPQGVAALLIGFGLMSQAQASDNRDSRNGRLPTNVEPLTYALFFDPHPDEKLFYGEETIKINVRQPTREIVLNSSDIKINEAECKWSGSSKPMKLKVHYEPKEEEVVLDSEQLLPVGECTVTTKFEGVLNDKLHGFFRSKVTDSEGRISWLAATQMEPIDARRMFPCFDEPEYKAVFSISTALEQNEVAISNSPVLKERTDKETKRKVVTFEPTPKMSTYLVALIVGKMVPSEITTAAGVPIRVWTPPGKENMTGFARELAAKVMEYYTQYFNVPYAGKKLDLIAIPDFPNQAMENLGACTFREELLLVDEKKGSLDAKQQIAINVAHELAHQWFGDLVTMEWWDDIWLNEAFAEWMSTKAVDKLKPNWQFRNQFTLEREQSMLSDSLRATVPIHAEIKNADMIDQVFDEITYQKGAAVLYMLENYLGEDIFRGGIRRYIAAHEFGNATPENLWSALSSESGKNISEIMHSWIYQKGFPLITVNSPAPKTAISQERFVFMQEKPDDKTSAVWQIPLRVRTLEENKISSHKILMLDKNAFLDTTEAAPLLVNAGGEGYYRVSYPANELRKLMSHLPEMTVLERASLLSDQFYLALAGKIPVKQYLEITSNYRDEDDPNVTSVLCDQFNEMNLLVDDPARADFATFIRDRLAHAKKAFGWSSSDADSDLKRRERAEVLLTLGTIGQDKDTITQARKFAEVYFSDSDADAVDSELFEPMLKIVAYNGNFQDFSKIEALWQKSKEPGRKLSALMALSMFQDPHLIEKGLAMSLSSKVEKQDAPLLVAAIMEGRAGRGLAWEFVRKHIIRIAWRFPEHLMLNLVMAMNALDTDKQLSEVQEFFRKHPVPSQARGINKIIEAIEIRVAFRKRADLSKVLAEIAKGST